MKLIINRGFTRDMETADTDHISISLFGHMEEQHLEGEDWWLFGRRPLSVRKRTKGERFRLATSSVELRIG